MGIPLVKYIQIKDNCCIKYTGLATEYLLQLQLLRPQIEQELSGLEIYLVCHNNVYSIFRDDPKVICESEFVEKRKEFAFIKDLQSPLNEHPVMSLIKESNIKLSPLEVQPVDITEICTISPKSNSPRTESLNNQQIENLKIYASKMGFVPEVSDNWNNGWVIGVENYCLFKAAATGRKTTLVETSKGSELYQILFPHAEILSPKNI